jgi:SAM-dependent methyltransferase
MLIAGAGGLVLVALASLARARFAWAGTLGAAAGTLGVLIAFYGNGMAAYMTWASRIGKLRSRERLLDLAGTLRPSGHWRGDEQVLDVGCGRGLLLVGAARRVSNGTAVGIDVWRTEDQSGNTPEAALENARREGVTCQLRVETGDARALPFDDATFDLVLSHWVVHNLADAADRTRAIAEMWRVLRPGGVMLLADIANFEAYREQVATFDAATTRVVDGGWEARIAGALSGGTYRPQALLARKRENAD